MTLRIEARSSEQPSRCVFCHDGPGDDLLHACACGATAHKSCREAAPKCATIGCSTPINKEQAKVCVSCGLADKNAMIFDTTWLDIHLGLICLSCIRCGVPDRMYRQIKLNNYYESRQNKPDEFMQAMGLLAVLSIVSVPLLFILWHLFGII